MDPLILQRLGAAFCTRLTRPDVFPPASVHAEGTGYPSDLGPVDDNAHSVKLPDMESEEEMLPHRRDSATDSEADMSAILNTTQMEISGIIAEFMFFRGKTQMFGDTLYVHGTDEQCARDDCAAFFHHTVGTCKFNSHVIGGFGAYLSDCGQYSYLVQNCSGNYVDQSCSLWHQRWPDVGLKENMTLVWNLTHGIGVDGTAAKNIGQAGGGDDLGKDEVLDLRSLADRFADAAQGFVLEG